MIANLNLDRKGQCEILPSSLDRAPQIELTLVRILILLAVFPEPVFSLWSLWGFPGGLILVMRDWRRGNSFPPPLIVSAWLTPFSLGHLIDG